MSSRSKVSFLDSSSHEVDDGNLSSQLLRDFNLEEYGFMGSPVASVSSSSCSLLRKVYDTRETELRQKFEVSSIEASSHKDDDGDHSKVFRNLDLEEFGFISSPVSNNIVAHVSSPSCSSLRKEYHDTLETELRQKLEVSSIEASSHKDDDGDRSKVFRNLDLEEFGFISSPVSNNIVAPVSSSSCSSLRKEDDSPETEFRRMLSKLPRISTSSSESERPSSYLSYPNISWPQPCFSNAGSYAAIPYGSNLVTQVRYNYVVIDHASLSLGWKNHGLNPYPRSYSMNHSYSTNQNQSESTRNNGYHSNPMLRQSFEYLFEMMTDKNGYSMFLELIEECDDLDLELIVRKITSQRPSLIDVACTTYGSTSIKGLIKRVKNLNLAKFVTFYLSTKFYELATHKIGKFVIEQCFILLNSNQNQVLYEAAIELCIQVALDPDGCIALNNCIDYITGSQRTRLLDCLSNESAYLSFDPSGNYVVQHILELENAEINFKICKCLQGKYARLSLIKFGSHIVEKCLQFCSSGIVFFIQDLKSGEKGIVVKLARDQFGNFVIQAALRITKQMACRDGYEFLVMNLEPHLKHLEKTIGGRNVVRMIMDETC